MSLHFKLYVCTHSIWHVLVKLKVKIINFVTGSPEQPPSKVVESETVVVNSDDRPPSNLTSPRSTPPQVSPKPVRKERSDSKSNSHQRNGASELADKEQHHAGMCIIKL